jgi:hypothetical protein
MKRDLCLVGCWLAFAMASVLRAQVSSNNSGTTAISPDPMVVNGVVQLLDESLSLLSTKNSDQDTQFYENGVWHLKQSQDPRAQAGMGLAAAILWQWRQKHGDGPNHLVTDPAWLHQVAIDTFNQAIHDHQAPGGWYGDKGKPDTYFFATALSLAYLTLESSLDAATRQNWLKTLNAEFAYMTAKGDLPGGPRGDGWYINGNVNLGEAELLYNMWKITADPKYKNLFEREWAFTMDPGTTRWKGFGLVYTKQPTQADGSDGAGYLAEAGTKGPGYDTDYAHVQLTVAAQLYVESHDPRDLRLLNLLINTLLPRVDQTSKQWVLDATNGSRHSLKFPFMTCGLAVATWLGKRDDLAPLLEDQFNKAVKSTYYGNAKQKWGASNLYLGYGANVGMWLLAADQAGYSN